MNLISHNLVLFIVSFSLVWTWNMLGALIFSTLILANSVTELNGGSSDVRFNGVAAHALIFQDTSQRNIGDEDSTDASSEEDPEELEATSEDSEETIEAVDEEDDNETEHDKGNEETETEE